MQEENLTKLGFRKGLDKGHRDFELLTRLEEAIIRHAKGWDRFLVDIPALLRQSIDEVIDAPRSQRFVIDELEKTEKTYLGTKVEILLRNHLNLDRGKVLDVRVDAIEVDIKNTIKSSWMIPRESVGHPCILISTDEKRAQCSFGLVVIENDILTSGSNQDKKKSICAAGMKNVHWMLKDKGYPRNFWESVSSEALAKITKPRGGTERLALLFELYQRVPVHRDVLLALAHQKDAMKRLRKNGGARDRLARDGIGLLSGKYNSALIAKLRLPHCGVNDFISVKPSTEEDNKMLREADVL
jgi:hypothetical protein